MPGFNQDTLLAAAAAAPQLDPQSAYGISQTTSDPSLAAESAVGTNAYAQATTAVNTLRQHDAATQNKLWQAMAPSEQQMYLSAGYKVPATSHGLWGDITGELGKAVGAIVSTPADLASTVQQTVGEGLHVLGSGLRAVQHAYRTSALVTDQNEMNGAGRWSLGTPAEWAQAWRDSTHGERTFLPSQVAKLTDQYGADTVGLARQLAGGTTPSQIVLALPQDQRQAMVDRLQSDLNLKAAVGALNNSKISFGRRVVGEHLQVSHPLLADVISGGLDATADIFSDPVVWGGKIAKAAELAPYILSDASKLGDILAKPGAQRLMQAATDALATPWTDEQGVKQAAGNVGALIRRFPRFSTIGQQLVDERVDSPEKLTAWFQGEAGQAAILDGRAGGMAPHSILMKDPGAVVPNLSRVGAAALPLKDAASEAIDWATTHHVPIVSSLARSLDRIATLTVAHGDKLDADSKDALTVVQRLADYALPRARANEVVNAFAAAPDEAAQFGTYKGLVSEVMDAMKVPEDFKNQFFNKLEGAASVHDYGINDAVDLNGQSTKVGITAAQVMDQGWSVPDFRELRMQADRNYVMDKLYGGINGDKASMFMRAWKPAQLLRLGMPIRTAGEELVGAMLREGPLGLIRARLAASSAAEGDLSPIHPFSAIFDRMTRNLPDSVVEKINTPSDFAGQVIGDRARRAFRYVEGRLAGPRYIDAAARAFSVNPDGLGEEISAVHQHGAGFLDTPDTVLKMTREGVQAKPAYLAPGDTYRGYSPTENLYTNIWHKNLDDYARDPFMKVAFAHADETPAEQVQAVIDKMNEPGMDFVVKKSVRSTQTVDGRIVGVDATRDEAIREWAQTVVDNANHVTTDAAGNRFDSLLRAVRSGKAPDITELNAIPTEIRPSSVSGPDMLPVHGSNKWNEIQTNGFGYIGRMINWISREPMFVHNMATSLDDVGVYRQLWQDAAEGANVEGHINEIAFQRALNKTIPFIHNPAVRSQFAEDGRNLMPFMFAQEQFMKRWALTAVHSPEAFREAQLSMMGLRHAGFVHTDPQTGQDYFMYPGAGMVQNLLSSVVSKWLGHDVTLPIPVGMSGQVQFATPGTERLGAPSFGPLVSLPLRALASRFPELTQLEQNVVGPRGAGRPYWEQIVPPSVARVVKVFEGNVETNPQMHSAALQAIQYLEATGHGLADKANPIEREIYYDRIKSWTRVLMVNRALFGFAAPAAPELQMDPNHLHEEFAALMKSLPIDEATKVFLQSHPDATPYTVFQTKSESGAPLPATTAAVDFMNTHQTFLQSYPQAGAWFLPQSSGNEQFSLPAYREQLALQLRQKKTFDEYYKDIKFAEAAQDYFDTRDARDAALLQAKGNSSLTQQINQQWTQFHDSYMAGHPVFEEQLLAPDAKLRRDHTVTQLRAALADPNLPQSPQTQEIRDMSDTYDAMTSYTAGFKGMHTSAATSAVKTAKTQFIDWAHQYIVEHPDVRGLYDRVYRLEVGDSGGN